MHSAPKMEAWICTQEDNATQRRDEDVCVCHHVMSQVRQDIDNRHMSRMGLEIMMKVARFQALP